MVIFEPSYYKNFSCLADKCRITCCKDWNVTFNKNDYNKLRSKRFPVKLREALGKCVKRSGSNEHGYAKLDFSENGHCPLMENGMCTLQITAGHENLPEVCQAYPRSKYLIGNTMLLVCSNSCEQVVKLLLKDNLTFERRTATKYEENNVANGADKVNTQGIEIYYEMIQTLSIAIMQNREYSLENRMLLLGMATKALQDIWIEKKLEEIPKWLARWAQVAIGNSLEEELTKLQGEFLIGIQSSAKNMAILADVNQSVKQSFDHVCDRIGIAIENDLIDEAAGSMVKYTVDVKKFTAASSHLSDILKDYPIFMENLLVNHLLTEVFPLKFIDNLFDGYLNICHNYALMRFMAIGYAGEDGTIDDVIDGIVNISRVISHSYGVVKLFLDQLKETGTDTLAHMAYLIRI